MINIIMEVIEKLLYFKDLIKEFLFDLNYDF